MNSFPTYLIPENTELFKSYDYDRILSLLKNEIHDFIIHRKNELDYFDLELFYRKYSYYEKINQDKMFLEIKNELFNLEWKVKLSFGDTGLFIYSSEVPPSSCW